MNTHEILEMAALDALGLLDPEEREEFETAFRAAPPALQAQVRREQLRVTRAQAILPDVQPPLGLRARVLAAVREAMQTVAARKTAAGAGVGAFRRPIGVNSLWRIGAIGSMAAAVAFGVAALEIRSDNETMRDAMASNMYSDYILKEYGRKFDQALFNPSTRLVGFAPTLASQSHGKATLLYDSEKKTGQIFVKDLPAGDAQYEVVVVDQAGNAVGSALITFSAAPAGVKDEQIPEIDLQSAKSLAIRRVGSDEVLLRAQGL